MAYLWKIGDLAVCVDDQGCKECGATPLVLRGIYRVGQVFVDGNIDQNGYIAPSGFGVGLYLPTVRQCCRADMIPCWNACRFRPIVSADTDFIEQMRALKPRVEAA